jgi:16S rRNA (cytosine967-C5)-methyltransferase
MLDEENDSVIAALLRSTPELQVTDTGLVVGVPTRYGRQLLPTTAGPDGFYYARLVRR